MFQFADPQYLYLLALIPLLILLYIYTTMRSRRRLQRYGTPALVEDLVEGRSRRRPVVKFVLLLSAISLVIVMLARPQYGIATSTQQKKGIEAAVMIDVSNSMLATDVQPNRLERAKLLVRTLIGSMENDKISFGVFAGEAYPQLPITNNYATANLFLDAVSTKMVTRQGTNMAAAIKLASSSFTDKKNVGKAIIVITDGESFEGGEAEAAKEAAEQGRQIFILGIGSEDGVTVATEDGILTDSDGKPVRSQLNEALCRDIAKAGKGQYLHVDNTNHAQQALLSAIGKMQQASESYDYSAYDEQFIAVALIVLLLLFMEFLIFPTKNSWLSSLHFFSKKSAQ